MYKQFLTIVLVSLIFTNCTKTSSSCGDSAFIDKDKFEKSQNNSGISIVKDPVIVDDCLEMELSYSGCNGNHNFEFVGSGEVAESLPVQTNFCIIDKNPQLCEAVFTSSVSFDLSDLRTYFKDEKKVKINLPDQKKSILWELE